MNRAAVTISTTWRELPGPQRVRLGGFLGFIVVIALLFAQPLASLMRYASEVELHSHIPLVPLVVAYLLFIGPGAHTSAYRTSIGGALLFGVVALGALSAALSWREGLSANDHLALMTLSFLSIAGAGGFLFLGAAWMGSVAFPLSFLLFMIPMPDGMTRWLEDASVQASADVAAWFFHVSGTPVLREGTLFALPGIALEVARECSGIRSSWALFISSVLASHLILDGFWRRVVLVMFVIPLAIIRNGFRILVIGLLCVHVGPHMIDSPIHHQGGPIFFAVSLGPLFALLWWLRRVGRPPA